MSVFLVAQAHSAGAASYQQVDETIVDPVQFVDAGGDHPYAGANLEPGASLPSVDLTAAHLDGADLIGADLSNADFTEASIVGGSLAGADLSDANLDAGVFDHSDFRGANLTDSSLWLSSFMHADFREAILTGWSHQFSNFEYANFSGVNLSGSTFRNTRLSHVDFSGAMGSANFYEGAAGLSVNFERADLRGVFFNEAGFGQSNFAAANLSGVGGTFAVGLIDSSFRFANFSDGGVDTLSRVGSDFRNANLRNFSLYDASIRGDLSGASMVGFLVYAGSVYAGYGDTAMVGVNLSGADLTGASIGVQGSFSGEHISLSGVTVEAANFSSAILRTKNVSLTTGAAFYDDQTDFSEAWISEVGGTLFDPATAGWINLSQVDTDSDGVVDALDNCRFVSNSTQANLDSDVVGDACDPSPTVSCDLRGSLPQSGADLTALQDNSCEDWTQVSQPGADLHGAVLTEAGLWSADFAGANLIGANFERANLIAAELPGADLTQSNLVDAVLAYSDLSQATLNDADLSGAILDSADATNSTLQDVNFDGADLLNADMSGADLDGAYWLGSITGAPIYDEATNFTNTSEAAPGGTEVDPFVAGWTFGPPDADADHVRDATDTCSLDSNHDQADGDGDGVGDVCDFELTMWRDDGTTGCFDPPLAAGYSALQSDLANGDVLVRGDQPCDCFGIEIPMPAGGVSVQITHVAPDSTITSFCENNAPHALGLAPGQDVCGTELNLDGEHLLTATPYDAANCEAGGGNVLPSSIRAFTIVPEPGTGVMLLAGLGWLAQLSTRRRNGRR